MEAIGLFFSKFSEELVSAQTALLSLTLALSIYWLLIRKKKRETAEWVPAALVRAYLDRVRADENETRIRLFGETNHAPLAQMLTSATSTQAEAALHKEVEALRSQLSVADSRVMEFDRTLAGLRAEKSTLEQKLKEAATAGTASAAGASAAAPNPALQKELEELRAKLREYEVIEDDLANLKNFKKENEELRQRLSKLEGSAPELKVVQGGAAAAPEAVTTVPGATEKIETPATVVPAAKAPEPAPVPAPAEAKAPAAPETKAAPAPVAEAKDNPAAPEANTNVLAPVKLPTAEEKTPKQKEEELLSEFEKMLAS